MKSFSYIIFISILFSCLGQVAADLYLPSLPAMAVGLQTSVNLAQTSVASYMFGYTIALLIYGPISDAIGRKSPLTVGLTLFLLGNIGCVFANSIYVLIAGRFLQGLGAGAGVVLGGAIVRNLLNNKNLAKAFSYLSLATITAIASAPFLGGYLQKFFGWRANFIFLLIYALMALGVCTIVLQETNQSRTKENLTTTKIRQNLYILFKNREFISYILTLFLIYAGILAWLTLGPIFLQNTLGLSPTSFGKIALMGGMAYACGAFLSSQITESYGSHKMINLAGVVGLLSGIVMLTSSLLHIINTLTLIIPVFGFIFSAGIIFPNAYAGALTPFPKIAGIAGAIAGSSQVLGGAISSEVISILPDNTALPIAITFIVSGGGILYLAQYRKSLANMARDK